MAFINEWITNIILFVLLATIIDMLLPSSGMHKYVKLVMGLLLIAIILSPILKLVSSDLDTLIRAVPGWDGETEQKMENSIELQKKEIQASQHAYILEETAEQLKESAEEELMESHELEISIIELGVDEQEDNFPDNLNNITVYLREREEEVEAVVMVEKIEINTNSPPSTNDRTKGSREIASLLAEKWGVEEDIIEIVIEGGDK